MNTNLINKRQDLWSNKWVTDIIPKYLTRTIQSEVESLKPWSSINYEWLY